MDKIYSKYIYHVFITRFLYITLIFTSLIFVLNILEEIKFFSNNQEIGIQYPIFLTLLNLPSILFEIFPFIILITTQFFFIKIQDKNEILIFRNNGVNNLKIIFHVTALVFILGILIITIFHFLSSNMKHSYLQIKNKYTGDNKYLAVINENGLWIKDKLNEEIVIINAEEIDKNLLKNVVISVFDLELRNKKNILAKEAIITDKIWEINDVVIVDSEGRKEKVEQSEIKTNFDYLKINSLFSNLESLTIYELHKQKKDFLSVGLTVSDIDIFINKIFSLPVSLVIFCVLSSILMLNVNFKKSKTMVIISGILLSVVIYYVYYFFNLLGSNNKLPIIVAIWLPNVVLFLSCIIGIININDK